MRAENEWANISREKLQELTGLVGIEGDMKVSTLQYIQTLAIRVAALEAQVEKLRTEQPAQRSALRVPCTKGGA